jgi:AcrR family transcriptional regulator
MNVSTLGGSAIAERTPGEERPRTRTRDPERKERILAAAADLIAQKGYHAVSIAEIGAAAGIIGSGIYRHFESKSSVLVDLFDPTLRTALPEPQRISSSPSPSAETGARPV